MEDFLGAMFAEAEPGTHTVITAFAGDPNKKEDARWGGRGWSCGQPVPAQYEWQNAYVTVSSFTPGVDRWSRPGHTRIWRPRRKEHFVQLHAIMLDDLGTKVPWDRARRLPFSALTETSPGNFQAWLFLRRNSDTMDRLIAERLIDAMVETGLTAEGLDPGMKGVTRFGRLPGGTNGKAANVKKLGHPFRVRCEEFAPDRRYWLAEIAEAWGLDMTLEAPRDPVLITSEELSYAHAAFALLLEFFRAREEYRGPKGDGWHFIRCPWTEDHTAAADNGAALAEPSAENEFQGGFACHHRCKDLYNIGDVWRFALEDEEFRAAYAQLIGQYDAVNCGADDPGADWMRSEGNG